METAREILIVASEGRSIKASSLLGLALEWFIYEALRFLNIHIILLENSRKLHLMR